MSDFPSEFHQLLQPFVGTFKAEVKLWFGPGDPHVSTGVMTNRFELMQQFLHQVYQGDDTDGPFPNFQGRGYWGYNTAANRYEGFWIDTASTIMMSEYGDVDDSGKVWTMRGEFNSPQSGQLMSKRSKITLEDDNRHLMEQFIESDEGEFKTMEIRYERIT